jgi:hypothetical protein
VLPSGMTARSSSFRYSATCIQFMSAIFILSPSYVAEFPAVGCRELLPVIDGRRGTRLNRASQLLEARADVG